MPWRALTLRFTAPVFHRIVIVCARLSQTPLMRSRTTAHSSHWSMCPVAALAHAWSAIDQRTKATSCTTSLRSQLWVSARSAGYEWHDTVSAVNIPPQGRLMYREYPNVAHCGLYCNRTPLVLFSLSHSSCTPCPTHPSPHAPPTPHPMPHPLHPMPHPPLTPCPTHSSPHAPPTPHPMPHPPLTPCPTHLPSPIQST